MRGVKRFEDLMIWQLACELRDGIAAALDAGPGRLDRDFRGQIGRSSGSAPTNIAEGFGYFKPRQFAKYLRIARGSTLETRNHVLDGSTRHYFSPEQTEHFVRLTKRIVGGTSRLIAYLDTCDPDLDLRPARQRPPSLTREP